MKKNNFQELERHQMEQRTVPPKIKKGIDAQVGFFQFVGNLFELFIPKMVDLFANKMTGGKENNANNNGISSDSKNNSKYPNQ